MYSNLGNFNLSKSPISSEGSIGMYFQSIKSNSFKFVGSMLNKFLSKGVHSLLPTSHSQEKKNKNKVIRCRLQDHPHCGVVCGPHQTLRTAPALKAQKLPHNHNFPTIHFNLFIKFLDKKNL